MNENKELSLYWRIFWNIPTIYFQAKNENLITNEILNFMANPIKETPTLSGKSSKKFNQDVAERLNKKVSREEKERILSNVKKILSKQKDARQ